MAKCFKTLQGLQVWNQSHKIIEKGKKCFVKKKAPSPPYDYTFSYPYL